MRERQSQPRFWFPQIPQNSPINVHSAAPVKAVNQVLGLFTDEPEPLRQIPISNEGKKQGVLSASSFCTRDILQFFEPGTKPPFYILGTVTENEAVLQSWNDLGLNLFYLPWGKEEKVFRYIPILSLPEMLEVAIRKAYDGHEDGCEHALRDLRWALCCEWIHKIQTCFGHGKRDTMQFYSVEQARNQIRGVIKSAPKKLPCLDCYVRKVLQEAHDEMPTEGEFQQILRRVANLDCQAYRLAPLSSILADTTFRYKRVVILEDNEKMGDHIATIITERYGHGVVQRAHVTKSLDKWRFCKEDGTEIKLRDEQCDEWDTLVCLDLEIADKERTYEIPGGIWLLYKTALHHPLASRLVITGYRTYDEKSFNAGTCAYLLKPFTNEELTVAIDTSSPFSVLWICPDSVREDWKQWVSKVDNEKDYGWIKSRLGAWLGQFHIRLDTISRFDESEVSESSVIIMDYYGINPIQDFKESQTEEPIPRNTQDVLVSDYLKARSYNPTANVLITLPMRDEIFQPGRVLHALGRILRDGHDVILHKPMLICSDHPEVSSLAQTIKTTLENRPLFDAKYVVYTPIMGLVWPKAKSFLEWQSQSTDNGPRKDVDAVDGWSPLGVLIGEIWGFTSFFREILNDPMLELQLSEKLDNERKRNEHRWRILPNEVSSNEIVQKFLSCLIEPGNRIVAHLTIERWLRAVLDKHISDEPGQRSLTEFLTRLFGGETRYEFTTRGGWYDSSGNFVQDVSIVIEFCGRRGIVAREAIERVVVNSLKSEGGEQAVLFQEIPLRGFLK